MNRSSRISATAVLALALAGLLALFATPATAATVAPAAQAPAAASDLGTLTSIVSGTFTDAATADKLARMMQAMSKAFLELPVGEIEAAAEGRQATRADRQRTVRQVGRNADGRLEVFVQRSDGRLWHRWQVAPNSSWSAWEAFDGTIGAF